MVVYPPWVIAGSVIASFMRGKTPSCIICAPPAEGVVTPEMSKHNVEVPYIDTVNYVRALPAVL